MAGADGLLELVVVVGVHDDVLGVPLLGFEVILLIGNVFDRDHYSLLLSDLGVAFKIGFLKGYNSVAVGPVLVNKFKQARLHVRLDAPDHLRDGEDGWVQVVHADGVVLLADRRCRSKQLSPLDQLEATGKHGLFLENLFLIIVSLKDPSSEHFLSLSLIRLSAFYLDVEHLVDGGVGEGDQVLRLANVCRHFNFGIQGDVRG